MYGQALKQSQWQRMRDESLAERPRERTAGRSHSGELVLTNLLAKGVKSVFVILWCLVYSVFRLAAIMAILIVAFLAVPVVLFGTLIVIGITLHVISLLFSGLGLN